MFLNEVALGKEKTITKDNSSLKKAPAGFDSVVARGTVEPGTVLSRLYSFSLKSPFVYHFNEVTKCSQDCFFFNQS